MVRPKIHKEDMRTISLYLPASSVDHTGYSSFSAKVIAALKCLEEVDYKKKMGDAPRYVQTSD